MQKMDITSILCAPSTLTRLTHKLRETNNTLLPREFLISTVQGHAYTKYLGLQIEAFASPPGSQSMTCKTSLSWLFSSS